MSAYVIVHPLFMSFLAMASSKEITGRFVKVGWGDYQHLTINAKGKDVGFWCVGGSKPISCDDLEKSPDLYKGKNIRVKYETKRVFVEQAGEQVNQDQVLAITLEK